MTAPHTVRLAALIAALALPAAAGDLAFVTSQNAGSVSIVDLDSGAIRATVQVAGAPAPVAYSPRAGRAYVISAETGALTVLTAGGTVAARLNLGEGAFGIAVAPQDGRLFVTDWYGARLRCLTPDGAELWQAPTGRAPAGVALSDDGRIVVTADRDDNRISAFDTRDGKPLWTAATGLHPYAVAFHGGRIWTTDVQSNSVTVIAEDGRTLGTVPVGDHPYGIAFAGGSGFVTDQYASTVTVFDAASLTPSGTIEVGDYPEGIAATSDGRAVVLTNWDSNELIVIDAESHQITRRIPVPDGPRSFGAFVGPAP